jgi:hypothetical protein
MRALDGGHVDWVGQVVEVDHLVGGRHEAGGRRLRWQHVDVDQLGRDLDGEHVDWVGQGVAFDHLVVGRHEAGGRR